MRELSLAMHPQGWTEPSPITLEVPMTLNPQIALFAALLAALGGPVGARSSEETETGEFRKAQTGLHRFLHESPHPDPEASSQESRAEVATVPPFSK